MAFVMGDVLELWPIFPLCVTHPTQAARMVTEWDHDPGQLSQQLQHLLTRQNVSFFIVAIMQAN